jgi:hypothetical protein
VPVKRGGIFALALTTLIALGFLGGFVVPYLTFDPAHFGTLWPRRGWLFMHIGFGSVALLAGPLQVWLGSTRRQLGLHRPLGYVYITCVLLSSIAAYYLAFHTDNGWVFGSGLVGLATTWLIVTGLAFLAIRRRLFVQHQEWMIRSTVVTFAFVTFRIFYGVVHEVLHIGTPEEALGAAAWFCWGAPLLVTEAVLQGRKILSARARGTSGPVSVEGAVLRT